MIPKDNPIIWILGPQVTSIQNVVILFSARICINVWKRNLLAMGLQKKQIGNNLSLENHIAHTFEVQFILQPEKNSFQDSDLCLNHPYLQHLIDVLSFTGFYLTRTYQRLDCFINKNMFSYY